MTKDKITIMYIIDMIAGLHGTEKYLLNLLKLMDKKRYSPIVVSLHSRYDVAEEFYGIGIPIIKLPVKKTCSPLSMRAYKRLYDLMKKYEIDVVETIHKTSDFIGPVIGRLAGAKVIISNRRDMGFMRTSRDEIAYRIVDRFVDRIKCNSKAAANHFSALEKVPITKFDVSYNGVEIGNYDMFAQDNNGIKDQYGIKEDEMVVGVLGGVKGVKGHIEFLEMAKNVSEKHGNVKFLVVGGGYKTEGDEYFDFIKKLSIEKELKGKVIFTGFIKDVTRILSVFDIAVLPSYTEGCSNVLLEYMAAGKPVIATNVGGNPELVMDGITGFVVPARDGNALAEKVNLLISSYKTRQEMGKEGFDRARECFDIKKVIDYEMMHYEKLIFQFRHANRRPTL